MSASTYNTLTGALAIGVLIAFAVMVISFIAMLVRWKTAKRRGHVVRLLIATAAIPSLIGTQQAILWKVFIPALGREQMAQMNALRVTRLAETSLVHVGDRAPNFSLATADGDELAVSDAKGKVVLINFFATWCGPCQMELPHIEQIWSENRGNDNLRLVVIGREESLEAVQEYRAKNGFTFPIAADPDRRVFSLFATESIPRTFVVSPRGIIVYSQAGFADTDIVQLRAVLKEQLSALQ
ncbi:MAG TPA: redoxin domain-containing protein [Pirellulaceae bacterium]|nr:redoxin domain-containing protein [Pirellulaceae bacterium]